MNTPHVGTALLRMAIASAYGSSPFYEYYADDINRFYDKPCKYRLDYNLKQIILII